MIFEAIQIIYHNKLNNFHAISATHAINMIWLFFYVVHYDITLIMLR